METNWNLWCARDLTNYFSQTYVGHVAEDGKVIPVLIQEVIRGEDGDASFLRGTRNREDITIPFTSERLRVVIPESQFVNCGRQTVYMSRQAQRQWKMGIRRQQFKSLYFSGARLLGTPNFNTQIIKELLSDEYPTFEEAVHAIRSGDVVSVAFNRHFALVISERLEGIQLYYKGVYCGGVNVLGDVILFNHSLLLQEKLDEALGGV